RPAATDDLYFVANGSGGHAFATTLRQHNRNVARWKALRSRMQEASNATE
ncbi:MAG: aminodeoxychorismate lyase, partial [Rhodospirillales bacterium]|nr:aminodeoxychorismate lyase [Rhodospirillales bacterium]